MTTTPYLSRPRAVARTPLTAARTPLTAARTPLVGSAVPTGMLGGLLAEAVAEAGRRLPRIRPGNDPAALRIHAAEDHEVWLRSWPPGSRSGFHDHGGSAGGFAVLTGTIREYVMRPALSSDVPPDVALAGGGRHELAAIDHRPGQIRLTSSAHVHDLSNEGGVPAITVHLRTPGVRRTTRYRWTGDRLAAVPIG